MPSPKAQAWCFTLNNYTDEEVEAVKTVECRGIKAGFEICPSTGTPHIQGAICFDKQFTRNQVKKMISNRLHLEKMAGSWEDQDYCFKEGNILRDEGEGLKQGRRSDLESVKRKFDKGASVLQLMDEDPHVMKGCWKMFERLEDYRDSKRIREEVMPQCLWLYGDTGVGKTHCVNEYAKSLQDKPYWKYKDGVWWDNYRGQKVVIMNEFRGGIPYEEMLAMCDKFHYEVSRRGRAPMPFLATIILVTSRASIQSIYAKENVENGCAELLRRFTQIEKKSGDNFTVESWLQ